jgi:hypothetical protein
MATGGDTAASDREHPREPIKAAAVASVPPSLSRSARGAVCILSRKPLHNITRVPPMALRDAGYDVRVVSLGAPVEELRQLSPQTDYIEVAPQPFTARLIGDINRRLSRRRNRLAQRELRQALALRRGGARGLLVRAHRIAVVPVAQAARCWRLLFAIPCAAMLMKGGQTFAATWRDLAGQEILCTLARFFAALQQHETTRAFARLAEAAECTSCRRAILSTWCLTRRGRISASFRGRAVS